MNKFHTGALIYPVDLCLNVKDLRSMGSFYGDLMGFEILSEDEKNVVLGTSGKKILTLTRPDNVILKPPRRTGLYHYAVLLPDRKYLGGFINHLRIKGFPLTGGADHKVSEAIYLQDPEDNGIEVYADVPDTQWTWQGDSVDMGTEPLDFRGLMELGKDLQWKGMPEGTRLGHMHLHVSDLEEAYKFYSTVGFQRVAEMGGTADFISTGGYHHHIGLNVWNGRGAKHAPENSTGLRFYTLAVPSNEELEKISDSLEKNGYWFERDQDRLYTKDPSGNSIALKSNKE